MSSCLPGDKQTVNTAGRKKTHVERQMFQRFIKLIYLFFIFCHHYKNFATTHASGAA